jgi:hypothetical protein
MDRLFTPTLWSALLHMRERWPESRFEMKAGYVQMGE